MTNAIYLTTTEPYSGKSIIALGLMNLLVSKTEKVAYFKPIISSEGSEKDGHLETIAAYFKLNTAYEEMFVFTRSEVIKHINAGNESYIIDKIIDQFKNLQERYDFVVIEGTDFMGGGTNVGFDGNISIAKNLGIPTAIIVKGEDKSVQEIVETALSTTKSFTDEGVQVLTVIANKIDIEDDEGHSSQLAKPCPKDIIVTSIPRNKDLGNPTMKDL
ncbi:MAG: AAA family ATPase [Flammeovirgaceae bacterium]|nr:AAA family ATPase [Flammeovirgaceae bacterium]